MRFSSDIRAELNKTYSSYQLTGETLTINALHLLGRGKMLDPNLEDGCTSVNTTVIGSEVKIHSLSVNIAKARVAIAAGQKTNVDPVLARIITKGE